MHLSFVLFRCAIGKKAGCIKMIFLPYFLKQEGDIGSG